MRLKLWFIVGFALVALIGEPVSAKNDKTQKQKEKEQKKLEKKLLKEEKYLSGNLAQTDTLPLTLTCKGTASYVRAGKITVNSVPLNDEFQKLAENECSTQMDDLASILPKPKSATCKIWFQGSKFNKSDTDVIRAVYQCSSTKPDEDKTWEEEVEVETATQTKSDKTVKLQCKKKGKAFLSVVSVKVNNVLVDESKFPLLSTENIDKECYGQTVRRLQAGESNKEMNIKCDIMNKKEYGGELEIRYQCFPTNHGYAQRYI